MVSPPVLFIPLPMPNSHHTFKKTDTGLWETNLRQTEINLSRMIFQSPENENDLRRILPTYKPKHYKIPDFQTKKRPSRMSPPPPVLYTKKADPLLYGESATIILRSMPTHKPAPWDTERHASLLGCNLARGNLLGRFRPFRCQLLHTGIQTCNLFVLHLQFFSLVLNQRKQ